MRIAHLADVHIGAPIVHKNEKIRRSFRESLTQFIKNLPETLEHHQVKLLLIAGDLLDTVDLSLSSQILINSFFQELEARNIRVLYVTGNHDWNAGDLALFNNFSENLQIINTDTPIQIEYAIDDELFKIIACGHNTAEENRNLIKTFPVKNSNVLHIGLVHCMVNASITVGDKYLPCALTDLISKNYDYWAIGHIHKRQFFQGIAGGYPGNPQAIKIDEIGPKGIEIIDISNGVLSHSFLETTVMPVIPLKIDISGSESLLDIVDIVTSKVAYISTPSILNITLYGRSFVATLLKTGAGMEAFYQELDLMMGETAYDISIDAVELPIETDLTVADFPWFEDAMRIVTTWQQENTPRLEGTVLHNTAQNPLNCLDDHLIKWFKEYIYENKDAQN